jgi:hypothetical protein
MGFLSKRLSVNTMTISIYQTLKKTLFVTAFVIFTFFSSLSFATGINIQGQIPTPDKATSHGGSSGETQNIKVSLAECNSPDHCEDVHALLANSDQALVRSETRIIVSDLSAEAIAFELKPQSLQLVEITHEAQNTLGFFEIDNADSEKTDATQKAPDSRRDKIQAVIFTSLQTTVGTLSLLFISKTRIEPAMVMTIVGGMTSLYFNWDVERWDTIQRWGRQKISNGLGYFGIQNWQKQKWFSSVSKAITGTTVRLGFVSLFVGISLWDNFASEFLTINTLKRVALSTAIGTFVSQPYDNVFGDWMERGSRVFSWSTIRFTMRLRSLIGAAVTPLVYAGNELGYAGALGLFAGGLALMAFDRMNHFEQSFVLNTDSAKSPGFFSRATSNIKCLLLFKKNKEKF